MSQPVNLSRPAFLSTELVLLALTAAMAAISAGLVVALGQRVDWGSFAWLSVWATGLVFVAAVCRQIFGMERAALWLMAIGVCTGFVSFSSLFAMTLFPISTPVIDPYLSRIDSALGFDLGVAPAWFSTLATWLQSMIPLAGLATITLLAADRRDTDLHRMLLSGVLALVATLGIWAVAPSFGPAAFDPNSALYAMAVGGVDVIQPVSPRTLFAFPSLDMIILMASAWYGRKTLGSWPLGFVAGFCVPVILFGHPHYLMDLVAGAALFAAVAVVAGRVINPAARGPVFQRRARPAFG